MFKTIKLQAYKLKSNLEVKVYRYKYPKQWVESFKSVNARLAKDKKHMPFKQIKEFLYSWDSNIVYINDLKNTYKDSTWILSTKPIDELLAVAIIKICFEETIENIKQPHVKEMFQEWVEKLDVVTNLESDYESLKLTRTDGELEENNLAFEVIPRLVYQQLQKQPLNIEHNIVHFIQSSNGLFSKPNNLYYEMKNNKIYYSIKVIAEIQTTPHQRLPMLHFKFSISRWMNYKLPLNNEWASRTSTYFNLDDRLVKIELVKEGDKLYWDTLQQKIYSTIYIGSTLPDVKSLVEKPNMYENIYVAHRLSFGKNFVGSGESMKDRHILNKWIQEEVSEIIEPLAPSLKSNSVIGQNSKIKISSNLENIENLYDTLLTVTGRNVLNIEILYMGDKTEWISTFKKELTDIFGAEEGEVNIANFKLNINYKQENEILSGLDGAKKTLERHEQKILQINEKLDEVKEMTMCFVLLPFLDENGELYYKAKEDPKKAIRAGLATTGRLSQFIDCSADKSNLNLRVKVAILDALRQLGYIDSFETRKYKTINYNTVFSGIHIINFKRTPYGITNRIFVYIERSANKGPTFVECPSLWKGRKYYWESSLEFQKISTFEGRKQFKANRIIKDIKDKIHELNHRKDEPHLLMIFSDGVTRKEWGFITDKNLASVDKKGDYTLKSIWFEKGKESEGVQFDEGNQLRIIRVRNNSEVPDYLTPLNDKGDYQSKTGIFILNGVYYSIGQKPKDKEYGNTRYSNNSKILMQNPNKTCKISNIVELYPIHLNSLDDPNEWISLVHNYREFAHQYKGTLQAPLLLHMASQLEEYIY